jgi:hypothetical protein
MSYLKEQAIQILVYLQEHEDHFLVLKDITKLVHHVLFPPNQP